MSFSDNVKRFMATLASIAHTRLELAVVELEEELVRMCSYLLHALIALFFAAMALALGVFFIIILFWDEHRIAVVLTLCAGFSLASLLISLKLQKLFKNKPRLLQQSMAEIKKDGKLFQAPSATQENVS